MALMFVRVRPRPDARSTIQTTVLDGTSYILAFYYVKNGDYWNMDISDLSETKLVAGIRLALGVDLLEPYKYIDGMPQGALFVYDTSRTDVEPALDGFDSRCALYYREAEAA